MKKGLRFFGVGLTLALVVGFLVLHTWLMSNYLQRVSDTQFSSSLPPVTRMQVQQGFAADGQVWIYNALELVKTDAWRMRHTAWDNPPEGREVHWNSAWAWWLLGLGKLRALVMGEPLTAAVEKAAVWANLPLLLAGIALLSTWCARRWGAVAMVVLAVGMAGHRDFYDALQPGYPDHHGSIVICLLGLLLGGVFMGAGWWRPASASQPSLLPVDESMALRAATASALFGATGLWISASSTVVPLAVLGVAAVLATFGLSQRLIQEGARFSPAVWRRWGRVGAAGSAAYYLLEYFPSGLAMHFEVNSPLYAIIWWAGAELVAVLGDCASARPLRRLNFGRLIWASAGLLSMTAVFWTAGEQGFVLKQPFMQRLHHHVDEFRTLWFHVQQDGWWSHFDHAALYFFTLILAVLMLVRSRSATTGLLLMVMLMVTVVLTALGWWQCRWLLTAGAAQIMLLMLLVYVWSSRPRNSGAAGAPSLALALLVAGVFYVPPSWRLLSDLLNVERVRDVRLTETLQLFYRDIAQHIAAEIAPGRAVVLASPNASVALSYYGDVRTVGTLYWENHAGMRRAAETWMAGSDADAARLIKETGVTHVVLTWPHDFLAEYHDALLPGLPLESTFGFRLRSYQIPPWLRPVAYRPPSALAHLKFRGDLYAVDFSQTPALAGFRQGLYLKESGELSLARGYFAAAAEAGNADAQVEIAWIMATAKDAAQRNAAQALVWAKAAVQAYPENARSRAVLAAAFAENGRFPEANGAILYAMELAEKSADATLNRPLLLQFRAYQNSRPWRE